MVSCKDCQYISTCNKAKFYHVGGGDIHSDYFCNDFKPVMVYSCSFCGQLINHPKYAWSYWVGNDPVCSSYCLRNLERKRWSKWKLKI